MAESVWDYPRPPRIEASTKHVRVELGGSVVADSTRAVRVVEKSLAPSYYLPPEDVAAGSLEPARGRTTFCEWKGTASYFDVLGAGGQRVPRAAWTYPEPAPEFVSIARWIAFYPAELECWLDGERAQPQEGGFYGGWITSEVEGPVKGGPRSEGW
jgi:uncharacterized protein (DUF427 family)